jgi:hypothetical protein
MPRLVAPAALVALGALGTIGAVVAPAVLPGAVPPASPAAAVARLHPNSFSSSFVLVQGAEVRLLLRVQAASLLEVVAADSDDDGLLSVPEVEAARGEIGAYLARHYALRADCDGDLAGGTPLAAELISIAVDEPGPGVDAASQWLEFTVHHRAAAPLRDLLFDVTLFLDTSPDHSDLCRLRWNERDELETLFNQGRTTAYFLPPEPDGDTPSGAAGTGGALGGGGSDDRLGLGGWVAMGFDHILGGWDHLAFVIALIVSAGRIASLLWVVTAFTLAHSITLALAATGVLSVSGRTTELLIAFSIAWVGVAALRARAPSARWPEAFVFGLVHGLGFAGFLGRALAGEERRLLPLLGFNLGVEAGQLAVVAAAVGLLLLLRTVSVQRAWRSGAQPPRHGAWLAPAAVRLPVAAAVSLAGAWWFVTRAGWI